MDNKNSLSKIDYELLQQIYPNNMPEILSKIEHNYPVQYLIGYVDFYGYHINVDERVLIPRFETEGLVAKTIALIKEYLETPIIIDIGTGSGCIAIALSKELKTSVDAIDISPGALSLAIENAQINGSSVNYYQKDIKNCTFSKKYNVLISNPPYVKEHAEVDPKTKYEPSLAIYAKDNGLEYYKIILEQSKKILLENSIISFEIGDNESADLKALIHLYYPHSIINIQKDLSGLDRYIFIINE